MKRASRGFKSRGVSLVETMIAVSIISVTFLAVMNVFGTISKSIQTSKAKTLASNLAQEKLQILRQLSYLRLMVTPVTAYNADFTPNIPYDNTYYTPETIIEGSIAFTRHSYVQTAVEVGNDIVPTNTSADTGMKIITCTVVWKMEGKPYMLQLRTIYSNPNTVRTTASFYGVVKTTSNSAISGASVVIAENMAWMDLTTSTGSYNIDCYDGNYTIVATKRGFFQKSVFRSIAPYQNLAQNFNLTAMSSGTVIGNAWINDHFVISQIVGSTVTVDGFDQEYIELYNPTTSYIQMVFGMAASPYEYVYNKYGEPEKTITMNYALMNSSIVPNGYFLIANTDTVNVFNTYIRADAVYKDAIVGGVPSSAYGANVIETPVAGGFGIRTTNWMTGVQTWIDKIGWYQNHSLGFGAWKKPDIYEGVPIIQDAGFTEGEQYVRMCSTNPAFSSDILGRSYDTDSNEYNIFDSTYMIYMPLNKDTTGYTVSGTPAVGAVVSCDDGLSLATYAKAVSTPYTHAEFRLTEVATGTWRVVISSYVSNRFGTHALTAEISTVTISYHGQELFIPSTTTVPSWTYPYNYSTFLTTVPAGGYIGGTVTNALGIPISPNIIVTVGGSKGAANTSTGRYLIPVGTGTMNVVANPTNDVLYNPHYVTQTEEFVFVDYGTVVSTVNFLLSQGGRVSGKVTRDGVNPLPNISIVALNASGASSGDNVTANDGKFTIINLATGTYTVQPVLDSGEKSSPVSLNALVTAGSNVFVGTFTIVGAFGTIKGNVTTSGGKISTGVLLVASTVTFTSPPTISSFTLTGAPYYFTNSYEDGTYSLEVRGSVIASYNVNAYWPAVNGLSTTSNNLQKTGIWVTPGGQTTGINFTW